YGDEGFISTTSAHASGSSCLMLQNGNTTIVDGRDELVSIPFDFAGQDSIIISYKWAFAQKTTNTNDRFRISGSSDCGNNWGLLKIHQGVSNLPTAPDTDGNFVPTSDQWMQNTIVLTNLSYMTDHFQVKFEFVGKGGNHFYLDDINIYTPGGTGVAELNSQMNAFLFPNPSQNEMKLQLEMSNAEEVDIQLWDATGRMVWNQNQTWVNKGENLISIPQQSAGLYVLRVQNQQGTLVKRAIFK
ncbi:MAG: hypothetical protein RL062_1480, partial [Bacteroidota bacterium]